MQADASRRARKLLSSSSPNAPVKARVLGVVHALLMLSLLGIAGLLAVLLGTRGEARYPTARLASFPSWMKQPVAGTDVEFTLYRNTGLFSLIAENLWSPNVSQRWGARVLQGVLRRVPTLRNNLGALTTLLAAGLGLLIALCVIAQYRRSVLAEAVSAARPRYAVRSTARCIGSGSRPCRPRGRGRS